MNCGESSTSSTGSCWFEYERLGRRTTVECRLFGSPFVAKRKTILMRYWMPSGSHSTRSRTLRASDQAPKEIRPMVGRLWFGANSSTPDRLPRLSKALASALQVDDLDISDWGTSLAGVLNRPTNPIGDSSTRWCFHLLVTLRSACQLATAAAHADDYPLFPDVLLRSVSRDLRQFLDGAIQILKAVPPPNIA